MVSIDLIFAGLGVQTLVRPKLSFLFAKLDFWQRREEVENQQPR